MGKKPRGGFHQNGKQNHLRRISLEGLSRITGREALQLRIWAEVVSMLFNAAGVSPARSMKETLKQTHSSLFKNNASFCSVFRDLSYPRLSNDMICEMEHHKLFYSCLLRAHCGLIIGLRDDKNTSGTLDSNPSS